MPDPAGHAARSATAGRSARSAGASRTSATTATGAAAYQISACSLPANRPTVENMTAPRITSASTLSSVCETSVPITTGSASRGRPSRRATISAREGSPSRAGSVADISTPTAVPCQASAKPRAHARQRGLQDRVPRDGAEDHREAHQRQADEHPARARGHERVADPVEADVLEREVGAGHGGDGRGAHPDRGARRAAACASRRAGAGSSDGSLRAGTRGPPTAGLDAHP